jgi:hypothetical protein
MGPPAKNCASKIVYKRRSFPRSTESMAVVESFSRSRQPSWARAVETAAAMEIEKVAFGDFYVMISTAAWKSLRKNHSGFSTVPTALTALSLLNRGNQTQHFFYSHSPKERENLEAAVKIFTELDAPRERSAVTEELKKFAGASGAD